MEGHVVRLRNHRITNQVPHSEYFDEVESRAVPVDVLVPVSHEVENFGRDSGQNVEDKVASNVLSAIIIRAFLMKI
ncbi:hypothetical protein TSAR_004100 [Trichomalopsis sarcophagae]|uniref:Uncharacterized protein n=1 Tax=Trichomalopsis sarcophagae TaxID=543379 RepID=A0A232F567_9HYME|nr:hypothetical protein TSAR_004100 [Trichomalopsis sarcophagae]